MRARRRRHRGYVLVVTLALLVLTASLLVGVSRAAFRHVIESHDAADSLQRRWAVISCRSAVLPYGEQVLAGIEDRQNRPAAAYRATVKLGNQTCDLIISDEQAKANVNALLDRYDDAEVRSLLQRSLAGTGLAGRVRVRSAVVPENPAKAPAGSATRPATEPAALPQAISGLGQIFDATPPGDLVAERYGKRAATDLVTCWGSGQLNIRRARAEVLALSAGRGLSDMQISRLIRARDETFQNKNATSRMSITGSPARPLSIPTDPLQRILGSAGLNPSAVSLAVPLTLSSKCHSLWVVSHDARRDSYYLTVLDETDPEHPRNFSFLW
ncbi:MAG: hypothetical protein JWL69_2161 [Phycisphaerales bacterium]|nr:hypothetical protein [Phycisphaerales bacterium]